MIEFLQMLAAFFPNTQTADAVFILSGLLVFCVFGLGMGYISRVVIPNESIELKGATPYHHGK